jgi:O-antigen ligase
MIAERQGWIGLCVPVPTRMTLRSVSIAWPSDLNQVRKAAFFCQAGVAAIVLLLVVLAFDLSIQSQFTLPKLFALQSGAAALVLLWAFRLRAGLFNTVPRIVLIPALLLVAWWSMTSAFAADASIALHGMRGRYNGLITQSTFVGLFLVFASLQANRRDWQWFVTMLIVTLVPVAGYAAVQHVGLDPFVWASPHSGSTIGHPVPLAALLNLAIPFIIAFLLTSETRQSRWTWSALLGMFLFASAGTLSRGPWLGAMVASGLVVTAAIRERIMPLRAPAVWIAALLWLAGAALLWDTTWLARVLGPLDDASALGAEPSLANRFIYYDAALRMLVDHPLLGVGLENYAVLFPHYRPLEVGILAPGATPAPAMVHNGYLQAAATTGVPGLLLYVTLVVAVVVVVTRGLSRLTSGTAIARRREWLVGVAFGAAIVGYLVQDLSGWQEISVSAFFWTIAGAGVGYCGTFRSERPPLIIKRRGVLASAVAVVAIGLMALAGQSWRAIHVDRTFFQAQLADPVHDWTRIQDKLRTGLQLAADDPYYLDAAGVVYLKRFNGTGERGAYDRAVALFNRARQLDRRNPNIVIHRIDLESAGLRRGIVTDSVGMGPLLATALALDPNNAATHETIARFRIAERKFQAAIPFIERALAIRPGHPGYGVLRGDALRGLGNLPGAISAYRKERALLTKGTAEWIDVEERLTQTIAEVANRPAR